MSRRIWPSYLISFTLWLALLAALLLVFWRGSVTFDDYSARFGSLSPTEFAEANATMDRLGAWTRGLLFYAVAPLDVVTLVLAVRARLAGPARGAVAIAVVVILVGLALALLAAIAAAMPSGGMVGMVG